MVEREWRRGKGLDGRKPSCPRCCIVEINGCVTEDASWLCVNDSSHINMVELDVVIKGLNLPVA